MFTESVVLMNTTGQLATFRHEITPALKNSPAKAPSPKFILRGDFSTDKQNMSIAFREVFKEFKSDTNEYKFKSENNDLLRKDRISDAFHMGEKLLFSNDNMRPKSRSKTSVTSQDISRVSPCGSDLRHQYSSSAMSKLDRHKTEDILIKTHSDVLSPISSNCSKDVKNDSNSNARDNLDLLTESLKKGKRLRKRNSLSVKSKKGKHGRVFTASTSLQDKQPSGLSQQNRTSCHLSKPGRISSEPPSKVSHASMLSYTLQNSGNGHAPKPLSNASPSNKQLHDIYPLQVTKTNSNALPATHGRSSNLTSNPIVNDINTTNAFEAQGQSVVIYKLEFNSRIKSAASLKSDAVSQVCNLREDSEVGTINSEELSLSAVSCNLQQLNKPSKTVLKYQQKDSATTKGLSSDAVSKEAVLTSIYGAVYQTADKVAAQAEELKKMKKIFLSDRQSGTIRESGMEFPCAPPATPTPDLLRKHEYVPSMSDIRSQRAVKSRLQAMEKEAHKKQEKRKEAQAKVEKQQLKDREKQTKAKQRKEIYALNKIMTELENKRFLDFCQAKGLNKV